MEPVARQADIATTNYVSVLGKRFTCRNFMIKYKYYWVWSVLSKILTSVGIWLSAIFEKTQRAPFAINFGGKPLSKGLSSTLFLMWCRAFEEYLTLQELPSSDHLKVSVNRATERAVQFSLDYFGAG